MVITKFKTHAHAFVDLPMTRISNNYKGLKVISLKAFGDAVISEDKELFDTFSYNGEISKEPYVNDKLAWCGFTHDFVISYCVYKGYKNIGLVGVADFIMGNHYSRDYKPFNCSDILKRTSMNFIRDVYEKGINIFTCNPDSSLEVPYIGVDELLK